jgi:hypothetical protein
MDPISTQLLAASQKEQEYDGCFAVGSTSNSPYITVYPFTRSAGFGTKYSDPSSTPFNFNGPSYTEGVNFTEDGSLLSVSQNNGTSGGIVIFNWSKSSGFGSYLTFSGNGSVFIGTGGPITSFPSEYGGGYYYILCSYAGNIWRAHAANSSTVNNTNIKSIGTGSVLTDLKFNFTRTYVLAVLSSLYIRAYPWTDGWVYSTVNLGTPLEATSQGAGWSYGDWHPSNLIVVVGKGGTTAGLRAINFGGGWGTTINDATSPMANLTGVKFSRSGKTVFTSSTSSPYIEAYSFDQATGFGAKFSNPSTLPGAACYDVAVPRTNDLVAVASSSSPYVHVYPWNDSTGFGTKYSNPSSLPPGNSRAIAFM